MNGIDDVDEHENMAIKLFLELLPLIQKNAVLNTRGDIVRFILEQGADVNALDELMARLLILAIENSLTNMVKFLLEHRANVNNTILPETPLHYALLVSDIDVVKLLLEFGANVNALTVTGCTPLHYAGEQHNVNTVKLLLECGANVNALNNINVTPLHNMLLKGAQADIVNLLLNHGTNVNNVDDFGRTPLHELFRAEKPDISVFHTLMKYGAHVNAVDKDGMSVLATALCNMVTPNEIIKLLLENGAITDFYNETNISIYITKPECFHFAELLIPYIVLRMSVDHEIFNVLDRFKSILLLRIIEDSNSYIRFLKIAHSCIKEIMNMKDDFVCEETLFQLVSKNCLRTNRYEESVSEFDVDTLLRLLKTDKYVVCRNIIYAAIKHSAIVDRLCELEVCYQTADSDTIIINYACIDNLTKYMSKDDVINLSIVFCDEFYDHECFSRYTSKKSVEENDEIVCKKPRH